MKAFKLNMHFRLPDDFTGDLNDAIEYMLKYRRNDSKNHNDIYNYDQELDQYENFMEMVTNTDRVLLADVWMAEFNKESGKWNHNENIEL